MKKLHSLAFYALVTPVITLSSGALLAEDTTGQDVDREHKSTQRDKDAMQSTPKTTQSDQDKQRAGQYDSRTAGDHHKMGEMSRTENRGFLDSAPASGLQASNLIGASVKSTADDDVGSVSDLIIDENGQVVAVVVGVGGFLGMGERDVAIGWDDVTRSGASDEVELRIDVTRESLRAAPEYKTEETED